ncbi:MAG: prepilin peptidase [Syntrophomonadaceae bacterium]|nr:prepilin peptidase [Syntrophomonadaceae bacterium]
MSINIVLVILCLIAAVYDVRWRRIPNMLVLTGIIIGLLYNSLQGGGPAFLIALLGLGLGIALLLIPFILGGMGAGDVKLLGMIGALMGPVFVVNTFLWTALWGGGMALAYLALDGRLWLLVVQVAGNYYPPILTKVSPSNKPHHHKVLMPYGMAICLGALSSMFWMWW